MVFRNTFRSDIFYTRKNKFLLFDIRRYLILTVIYFQLYFATVSLPYIPAIPHGSNALFSCESINKEKFSNLVEMRISELGEAFFLSENDAGAGFIIDKKILLSAEQLIENIGIRNELENNISYIFNILDGHLDNCDGKIFAADVSIVEKTRLHIKEIRDLNNFIVQSKNKLDSIKTKLKEKIMKSFYEFCNVFTEISKSLYESKGNKLTCSNSIGSLEVYNYQNMINKINEYINSYLNKTNDKEYIKQELNQNAEDFKSFLLKCSRIKLDKIQISGQIMSNFFNLLFSPLNDEIQIKEIYDIFESMQKNNYEANAQFKHLARIMQDTKNLLKFIKENMKAVEFECKRNFFEIESKKITNEFNEMVKILRIEIFSEGKKILEKRIDKFMEQSRSLLKMADIMLRITKIEFSFHPQTLLNRMNIEYEGKDEEKIENKVLNFDFSSLELKIIYEEEKKNDSGDINYEDLKNVRDLYIAEHFQRLLYEKLESVTNKIIPHFIDNLKEKIRTADADKSKFILIDQLGPDLDSAISKIYALTSTKNKPEKKIPDNKKNVFSMKTFGTGLIVIFFVAFLFTKLFTRYL